MDNKEMLDTAIQALESLRDKGLRYVRVDTSDDGVGELNLSIDVDFYDKPKLHSKDV